jgi:hypothetical protein
VRTRPTAAEQQAGCQPLLPGEYLVTSGTLELAGALDNATAVAGPPEHLVH